jgi:predicted permease
VDEVEVGWVTPGFLEALGVRPHIGRLPTPAELTAEKPEVIVLSFDFWQSRYGGDPAILGRTIDFDDVRWTVVGVMPPGFRMLFPPEEGVPEELAAWLPWGGNAYSEMSRAFRVFTTVARLRPAASRAEAGEEMRALAERVREASTEYQASGLGLRLEPLAEGVAAHVRPTLLILSGVVAFVLLIAGANVANLSLAQAAAAERDLAVRAALGASRRRLLRQILVESALLGALGAGVGVLLAAWGLELLRLFEPGRLPRVHEVAVDARALAAAGGAAFLAALLSGGMAAGWSLRRAAVASLHLGARGAAAPPPLLRRLLVVSQLALSLVLLAGAGLLLRSVVRLGRVDPGFEPRGLLTLRLSLPDVHYPYRDQGPKIADFYRRLEESVGQMPGVERVGATLRPPLSGDPIPTRPYAWRTGEGETEWGATVARYGVVTPGWFPAAGVRLLAGRFLNAHDDRDRPLAVVVDAPLARRAWPGRNAVGQAIRVEVFRDAEFRPAWGEVVGVIEPVRLGRLDVLEGEQVYLAHAQTPMRTMFLTVRAAGDPRALVPAVQARVGALEKDLPVFDVRLATEHVARATAVTRFALLALASFAGVAALLAAAGVYAVMAFSVSRRRQEIGVRMALGASPGTILSLVVGEASRLVGAGAGAGLLGALALTHLLSALLFGVTPTDPVTFGAVSGLLGATALLACLVPAWRAARIDPTEALRAE